MRSGGAFDWLMFVKHRSLELVCSLRADIYWLIASLLSAVEDMHQQSKKSVLLHYLPTYCFCWTKVWVTWLFARNVREASCLVTGVGGCGRRWWEKHDVQRSQRCMRRVGRLFGLVRRKAWFAGGNLHGAMPGICYFVYCNFKSRWELFFQSLWFFQQRIFHSLFRRKSQPWTELTSWIV